LCVMALSMMFPTSRLVFKEWCTTIECQGLQRHFKGSCTRQEDFKIRRAAQRVAAKEAWEKQSTTGEKQKDQMDRFNLGLDELKHAYSQDLCLRYLKFGGCKHGDACRYKHPEDSDCVSTTADQDWSVPQRPKLPYVPKLSDAEEKELRKIEKKLRDIATIEAKIAAGVRVDCLQRQKVQTKDALVKSIIWQKVQIGFARPDLSRR